MRKAAAAPELAAASEPELANLRHYFPAMVWGWQKPAQEPAFAAREVPMGYKGRAGTRGRVLRLGVAFALSARGLKGCDVALSLGSGPNAYLLVFNKSAETADESAKRGVSPPQGLRPLVLVALAP